MNVSEKLATVKKYLEKNKEKNVVEVIIKDYNAANFYISLVFNSRIDKFKVVFIPLDIMDSKKVEDYACYQFVQIQLVNYILETISESKMKYLDDSFRDRKNKNIDSYYIEINTHVEGEDFKFKTTQYIPKEWMFFYEIICLLFQHAPNIVSELGRDLLAVLNNTTEMIEYKSSLHFDLFNDDIDKLFKEKYNVSCEEEEISFLEKINNRYYAIVDDHIVIVDYNCGKKILNLYCDCSDTTPGSHIYSVLKAIVAGKSSKFYKLIVGEDKDNFIDDTGKFKFYLCYGVTSNGVKVIQRTKPEILPFSMFMDGLIKIGYDSDVGLENEVKKYLVEKYDKNDVLAVIKNVRGVLPR